MPTLGFLLDVDNTLLDNDALKRDIDARLSALLGADGARLFWAVYEDVRVERGVVDLPLTVERYTTRTDQSALGGAIHQALDDLPFSRYVYPETIEALRHLASLGRVAILSDGDQGFQREKIERSGLAGAVDNHVLIYAHKEEHLAEIAAYQPVDRSVIVDDKARILQAMKEALGTKVVTVHVLQGHYAHQAEYEEYTPDITVGSIGDLRAMPRERFTT